MGKISLDDCHNVSSTKASTNCVNVFRQLCRTMGRTSNIYLNSYN